MNARTLTKLVITAVLGMTIAALAGGTVITQPVLIPNNAVTDAKLRDSNGLSVIGRTANSSGDPADIIASSDDTVLRRSGTAIGFGAIPESTVTNLTTDLAAKTATSRAINTTAPLAGGGDLSADRTFSISTNGISDTLLRDSGAMSVIGRSANSSGDPADISTSADGDVLRRSGTTLGFGQIATAGITDNAVTLAKMATVATATFLGRTTASTGNVEALTATQATAMLNTFTSVLKGLVPASGGGTTTFLRADGTWATTSYSGDPGLYAVVGTGGPNVASGTCNFDGVATPVCNADLTGSTYRMNSDIVATNATVTVGKRLRTDYYRITISNTLTVNGSIDADGSAGSPGTGGSRQNTNTTCGAGANGAASGNGTAQSTGPLGIFYTNSTANNGANTPSAGSIGPAPGRGGGGGGGKFTGGGGSAGGSGGTMTANGTYGTDTLALMMCRNADAVIFTGGTGGGAGGANANAGSSCSQGGGGAGGGVLTIKAKTLAGTGTISSNGGAGGNGGNGVGTQYGCGGGGGGGGGLVNLFFHTYSGSVTVSASGGTHGTGVANGGTASDGGDGAAGVVTCDNTSGDGTKPTGCP